MATYKGFKGLNAALKTFINTTAKKSMVTAANRAIDSGRSKAVKAAGASTGVTQKRLSNRAVAFKANANKATATLLLDSKPIALSAFSPKEKAVKSARGRRYGATTKGPTGRSLVTGGFLRKAKGGNLEVFTSMRVKGKLDLARTDIVFRLWKRELSQYENHVTGEFTKNFEREMKRRGGSL